MYHVSSLQQLDLAFFVPTIAAALEEQRGVYDQICLSIEEMTRKVFNEFINTIEYVGVVRFVLPLETTFIIESMCFITSSQACRFNMHELYVALQC